MESLAAMVSNRCVAFDADRLDELISYVLEAVGRFVGVDRAYLYLLSEDRKTIEQTFEWFCQELAPKATNYVGYRLASLPWSVERLTSFEPVRIPRAVDLPEEASPEREAIDANGIRSTLALPIRSGDSLIGVLGLNTERSERDWADDDVNLLVLIGEILSNVLTRARTERALRESEERYRGIFAASIDAIVIGDEQFRVVDANPAACEFYGYTRQELLQLSANDLVHPDHRHLVAEMREAVENRGSFHLETVDRRKDGTSIHVELSGRRFHYKGEPRILVVVRDITERKRAEETLRASEMRYRQLYEHSTDGIASVAMNGTILRCNPAYEEMVGYTLDELRTMSFWDLTPEKWHEKEAKILEEHLVPRGCTDPYEKEYSRKDGTIVPIEVNAFSIPGDNGKPIGMWGIARDISERKRSEEHDREHQFELAHASRLSLMGEMAAGLAHELNQPLGSIANYAGACVKRLQSDPFDKAKVLDNLERITRQAERAGQVIRNLRAFLRKQPDRRLVHDINDVIHDAFQLTESEARRLGISVDLDLAPTLPPVQIVPIEIEQVLVNLIKNALESVQNVEPLDKRLLISSGLRGDDGIEVSVRDWGTGVRPDLLSQVFEPFLTTKPRGMGMGLAICRRIIDAHGGRLWLGQTRKRGAMFHFSLPKAMEIVDDGV
jgi:two-component system sensor kinase FixL